MSEFGIGEEKGSRACLGMWVWGGDGAKRLNYKGKKMRLTFKDLIFFFKSSSLVCQGRRGSEIRRFGWVLTPMLTSSVMAGRNSQLLWASVCSSVKWGNNCACLIGFPGALGEMFGKLESSRRLLLLGLIRWGGWGTNFFILYKVSPWAGKREWIHFVGPWNR